MVVVMADKLSDSAREKMRARRQVCGPAQLGLINLLDQG